MVVSAIRLRGWDVKKYEVKSEANKSTKYKLVVLKSAGCQGRGDLNCRPLKKEEWACLPRIIPYYCLFFPLPCPNFLKRKWRYIANARKPRLGTRKVATVFTPRGKNSIHRFLKKKRKAVASSSKIAMKIFHYHA